MNTIRRKDFPVPPGIRRHPCLRVIGAWISYALVLAWKKAFALVNEQSSLLGPAFESRMDWCWWWGERQPVTQADQAAVKRPFLVELKRHFTVRRFQRALVTENEGF